MVVITEYGGSAGGSMVKPEYVVYHNEATSPQSLSKAQSLSPSTYALRKSYAASDDTLPDDGPVAASRPKLSSLPAIRGHANTPQVVSARSNAALDARSGTRLFRSEVFQKWD